VRLARGSFEELITGAWGDPLQCGSRLAVTAAAAPRWDLGIFAFGILDSRFKHFCIWAF
jgi:hypothetical protein